MRTSSSSSSQKDLSVYEFNEEEEAVEAASQKYAARLQSRLNCHKNESSTAADKTITKYTFLQAFSSRLHFKQGDVTGVLCIDLPETDNNRRSYTTEIRDQNLTSSDEKVELDEIVGSLTRYDEHGQMCTDGLEDGLLGQMNSLGVGNSAVLLTSVGNGTFTNLPSDDIAVDGFSGNEGSWASLSGSPTTTSSDTDKTEGCPLPPNSEYVCSALEEKFHNDIEVVVSPDFVIYGSTVYGESQLAFCSDCLKVECSDVSENDDKLVAEWASADIIHIRCQWSRIIDAAFVELLLKSTEVTDTEKPDTDPDLVRIRFSVNDMQWLEKEQKIKNLSARYKDIWNIHSSSSDDLAWEVDDVGRNVSFSRKYFTEIQEPFDDVIYPKGDPDAVSISKRDIELLQPETFINDTIIDFYIKYLKNKIQESEKHRFHFFNSFFFRKLADLDKDRCHDSEGRAAFLRVRKWTRKVNIFEKDYIFIPVNFNLHWSLLVICHPGEIVNLKVDDLTESPKVPCILHMDSIKGSHSGLKNIIQSYIWEEWKERHPDSIEIDASKFSNLRFVELELPQQENSFDCGLFLLHYAELFLVEAPMNFNPFKILKFSNFLNADWFSPAEASLKRMLIRKLIYDLLNDSAQKVASIPFGNGQVETSGNQECNTEKEPLVELLPKQCSPVRGDTVFSVTGRGIHLLPPSGITQYDEQDGPIFREFMEAGATTIPSSEQMEHANQSASCLDHQEKSGELVTSQLCTTSFPAAVGAYEVSVSSMKEKDSDENFLVGSLNADCTIQSDKAGKSVTGSQEDFGYVPDSPVSGENIDVHIEDSMETDTAKAEQRHRKDAERLDVNNVGSNDGVGRNELRPDKLEVNDTEDLDVPTKDTLEDVTKASETGGEVCLQISTTGTAICNRDCQETYGVEVDRGDSDGQEIRPPEFSQDAVTSDCDRSDDIDDVQLIDVRVDQQPSKRRRVMISEGHRIRTRRFSRDCHPET